MAARPGDVVNRHGDLLLVDGARAKYGMVIIGLDQLGALLYGWRIKNVHVRGEWVLVTRDEYARVMSKRQEVGRT